MSKIAPKTKINANWGGSRMPCFCESPPRSHQRLGQRGVEVWKFTRCKTMLGKTSKFAQKHDENNSKQWDCLAQSRKHERRKIEIAKLVPCEAFFVCFLHFTAFNPPRFPRERLWRSRGIALAFHEAYAQSDHSRERSFGVHFGFSLAQKFLPIIRCFLQLSRILQPSKTRSFITRTFNAQAFGDVGANCEFIVSLCKKPCNVLVTCLIIL